MGRQAMIAGDETTERKQPIVGIDDLVSAQDAVRAALASAMEQARDYAKESKATNTRRAYRSDWADFAAWCAAHALAALPAAPETVALYLAAQAADRKPSTLARRLTAIAQAHKTAGYESPTTHPSVRQVVAGIRRAKGTAQEGKAAAVTREVRAMCEALPSVPALRRQRDAALLLVGFAGAFRRSELVALDVADVAWKTEGLEVAIRRGKTDQEGQGRKIGIPYGSTPTSCPVRALRAWLDAAGIADGSLFRGITRHDGLLPDRLSDKGVARVVKRAAAAAGLDARIYSGHSLRAGLATAAAQAGISERAIMAQTGHKSIPMVRKYIRDGSLWRENAAAGVGL
jgi:integrase